MRYLKTGCCGCTLKNSTLAIGGMCTVNSILGFLATIYFIKSSSLEDQRAPGLIIGILLSALFSVLLVGGVIQNNKVMLIPWLTIWGIEVASLAIATGIVYLLVILSVFANTGIQKYSTQQLVIFLIVLILVFSPSFYLWLIVMSFYAELSAEENDDHVQVPLASVPKNPYSAVDNTAP